MNIEKPDITPICCSKEAKWVVQSPNLAYWYCSVCKCEPKPVEKSDWYGLQNTLDEINAGINKANGLSNWNHGGLAAWLPSPGAPPLVLPTPPPPTTAPATVGSIYNYDGPRGTEEVRLMNISSNGGRYELIATRDAKRYTIGYTEWQLAITTLAKTGVAPVPAGTPHWTALVSIGSKWKSTHTGEEYQVVSLDLLAEEIKVVHLTAYSGAFINFYKDDFFKYLTPLP